MSEPDRIFVYRDANYQRRWSDTPRIGAAEYVRAPDPDAIAARDREIAELRAERDNLANALDSAYFTLDAGRSIRPRTIEECAKVADAELAKHNTGSGFDSQPAHSTAFAIAAAIRSLGKEGSGE